MADILYILKNGETESVVGDYWLFGNSGLPIVFGDGDPLLCNEGGPVRAWSKKFEYVDQFMGERYVMLTISSPTPISWEKGDWCFVHGEKMTLRYIPTGKKQARKESHGEAFLYENVKFTSITGDLSTRDFMDYRSGDNASYFTGLGEFSFYVDKMRNLADRIQANLEVHYPNLWLVSVKTDDSKIKKQSVSISSGTNILSAVAIANSQFDQNYSIEVKPSGTIVYPDEVTGARLKDLGILEKNSDGKYVLKQPFNVITIGGDAEFMPATLYYGMGQGLRRLEVNTQPDTAAVTRLRAFGSTKNIPYRYYNQKYKKRRPNGEKIYPMFWEGEKYLLDATNIRNLMLPLEIPTGKTDAEGNPIAINLWNKKTVNGQSVFSVYVDAIKDNYTYAGYTDKAASAPSVLEDAKVFEYQKKFETDDADYDECYPTLEEMTIDSSWEGVFRYNSNYRTDKTLGYKPTVKNVVQQYVENLPYTYNLLGGPSVLIDSATHTNALYLLYGNTEDNAKKVIDVIIASDVRSIKDKILDDFLSNLDIDSDTNLIKNTKYGSAPYYNQGTHSDIVSVGGNRIYTMHLGNGNTKTVTVGKGMYEVKIQISIKWSGADIIKMLTRGYAEPSGSEDIAGYTFNETTSNMEALTSEMIQAIKNDTYQKSGRLDKVISKSLITGKSTAVEDCGIPYDETVVQNVNGCDIYGKLIEPTFNLIIPDVCFDITDWVNSDGAKICMKTGMCAGREFTIGTCIKHSTMNAWTLLLNREYDSELNMIFPNANYLIKEGDEYIITGITMPDVYVDAAERKLFRNAMKFLSNADTFAKTFSVELDNKWLAEHYDSYTSKLRAGKKFLFSDCDYNKTTGTYDNQKDLGLGEVAIFIKQVTIHYGDNIIPTYEITLDDDSESISISNAISNEVKAAKLDLNSVIGGVANTANNALSKTSEDVAQEHIEFAKGISSKGDSDFTEATFTEVLKVDGDLVVGNNLSGMSTNGYISIGSEGNKYQMRFVKGILVSIIDPSGNEILK